MFDDRPQTKMIGKYRLHYPLRDCLLVINAELLADGWAPDVAPTEAALSGVRELREQGGVVAVHVNAELRPYLADSQRFADWLAEHYLIAATHLITATNSAELRNELEPLLLGDRTEVVCVEAQPPSATSPLDGMNVILKVENHDLFGDQWHERSFIEWRRCSPTAELALLAAAD